MVSCHDVPTLRRRAPRRAARNGLPRLRCGGVPGARHGRFLGRARDADGRLSTLPRRRRALLAAGVVVVVSGLVTVASLLVQGGGSVGGGSTRTDAAGRAGALPDRVGGAAPTRIGPGPDTGTDTSTGTGTGADTDTGADPEAPGAPRGTPPGPSASPGTAAASPSGRVPAARRAGTGSADVSRAGTRAGTRSTPAASTAAGATAGSARSRCRAARPRTGAPRPPGPGGWAGVQRVRADRLRPRERKPARRRRGPDRLPGALRPGRRGLRVHGFRRGPDGTPGSAVPVRSYPVKGDVFAVQLIDRGRDWGDAKRVGAHHAAAQMKASCH